MSIFNTINTLKEEFDKFQAIEWTVTSMVVVGLLLLFMYRKTIFIVIRVMLEPINVFKYVFDKSVSFDGETFLLSFNSC